MKIVWPPTARHARTGELTAPGIAAAARASKPAEIFVSIMFRLYSLNTAHDARETRLTITCSKVSRSHDGSRSQKARSPTDRGANHRSRSNFSFHDSLKKSRA